jgi:hypothetical protein
MRFWINPQGLPPLFVPIWRGDTDDEVLKTACAAKGMDPYIGSLF